MSLELFVLHSKATRTHNTQLHAHNKATACGRGMPLDVEYLNSRLLVRSPWESCMSCDEGDRDLTWFSSSPEETADNPTVTLQSTLLKTWSILGLSPRCAWYHDITQRRVVIPYRVTGQTIGSIFKGQELFLNLLTSNMGKTIICRNVGTELLL